MLVYSVRSLIPLYVAAQKRIQWGFLGSTPSIFFEKPIITKSKNVMSQTPPPSLFPKKPGYAPVTA